MGAKKLVLWAVLVAFPVWVVTGFVTLQNARSTASAPVAAPPVGSPGLAVARARLALWLGTDPAPLQGGQIVAWGEADHSRGRLGR